MNGHGDALSESLAELQEELHHMVSAALRDRDEAHSAQDKMAREMGVLRNRLSHYQQKYQSACEEAQQAKVSWLFCTVPPGTCIISYCEHLNLDPVFVLAHRQNGFHMVSQ